MSEINTSRLYTSNNTTADPLNISPTNSTISDSTIVQMAHDAFNSAPTLIANSSTTTPFTPRHALETTQISTNQASTNAAARFILNPPHQSLILEQFTTQPITTNNIDTLYAQTVTQYHNYTQADLQFADCAVITKIHMQIAEEGKLTYEQQQQLYQALNTIAIATKQQELNTAQTQIQDLPLTDKAYKLICQLMQNKQALMDKLTLAQEICTQSECTIAARDFVQECQKEFTTALTQKPSFGKASLALVAASLTIPALNFREKYPCLEENEIALFKDCLAKIEHHNATFDIINRDYGGQGHIGEALQLYAKEHFAKAESQLQNLLANAKDPASLQLHLTYPDFTNKLDSLYAQHQAQIGHKMISALRTEAAPLLHELKSAYFDQLSQQSAIFANLRQNAGDEAALTALQAANNEITQLERLASTYQDGINAFIQDFKGLLTNSDISTITDYSNVFAQKLMQIVINNYITSNQELRQIQHHAAHATDADHATTAYQNHAQALSARENNLSFIKHLAQLLPQNIQVQQALKAADGRALLSNLIPEFHSRGLNVDHNNIDSLMQLGQCYFTMHPKELKFLNSCDLIFIQALKQLYESDISKSKIAISAARPIDSDSNAISNNELSFYQALGLDQNTALGFAALDLKHYVSTAQLKDIRNAFDGCNAATAFKPQEFFNFLLDVVEPGKQKMRAAINFHLQNTLKISAPVIDAQSTNSIKQIFKEAITEKLPQVTQAAEDIEAAAFVELNVDSIKLDNCQTPASQQLLLKQLNANQQKQFTQAIQNIDEPSNKATLLALYDIATAKITSGETENVPNLYLQSILARNAGDLSSSQLAAFHLTREDAKALVELGNDTTDSSANTASTRDAQQQLLNKILISLCIFNGSHDSLSYRALAYSYLQAKTKLNFTNIADLADNNEIAFSASEIKSLQDQFASPALTRLQAIAKLKLPTTQSGINGFISRISHHDNEGFIALEKAAQNATKGQLDEATAQKEITRFIEQKKLFSDTVIEQAETILCLKQRKDEYAQVGDAIERIQKKIFTPAYFNTLQQTQDQTADTQQLAPKNTIDRASQQFAASYASYVGMSSLERQQQAISQKIKTAYQLNAEHAKLNRAIIDCTVNQLALEQGLDSKEQLLTAIYAEGNFNRLAINTQAPQSAALIKALQDIGYDQQKAVIYIREYLADSKFLESVQDLRWQNLQRTINFFSQNLDQSGRNQISRMAYASAISSAYTDTVRSLNTGEGMCFSKTRGAELKLKLSEVDVKMGLAAGAEFAFKKNTDNQTIVSLSRSYLAELGMGVELNDNLSVEANIQGSINKAVEFSFVSAEEAVNFFARLLTATLTAADYKRFDEISISKDGRIGAFAQASVSVSQGNENIEASAALEASVEAGVSYKKQIDRNGVNHTFATDVTLMATASFKVGKAEDEDEAENTSESDETSSSNLTYLAKTIAQDVIEDKTDTLKTQIDKSLQQNVNDPLNEALNSSSYPINDTIIQPTFTFSTEGINLEITGQYTVENSISTTHSHFDDFIQKINKTKTIKNLSMPVFEDFCAKNHLTLKQRNSLVAYMNELANKNATITGFALSFTLPPKHFAGELYTATNTLRTAAIHADDFELQGFSIEAEFDPSEINNEHELNVLGGLRLYNTSIHGHSLSLQGDFTA